MSGFKKWQFLWAQTGNEPRDKVAIRIEGEYAFIVKHDGEPTGPVTLHVGPADLNKFVDNLDQPRKTLELETTSIDEATEIADKILVEVGYIKG